MINAFLVSTGIVTLAEIGDKTQLLALLLAARFKRPIPIALGILIATIFNHTLAGAVGSWITTTLGPDMMRWILGVSFIGIAIWTLIPDKIDEDAQFKEKFGAFGTTLVAFFLAEMGDKTQFATIALAAKFNAMVPVIMGTTAGMLIADLPAIWFGNAMADKLPVRFIHIVAAIIFAVMGILALVMPLE